MKIAIQAADLDENRIDGTRVYIFNLLKRFGQISSEDEFWIYHKKDFNPSLAVPKLENYHLVQKNSPFLWTQSRFAWEVYQKEIDSLWMPMHDLPLWRRKGMRTVVTIHDLAFKTFPQYFPKKDLVKINSLTNYVIPRADGLIAISEVTKRNILKFYPQIKEKKIKVIHHGFDEGIFQKEISQEKILQVLTEFGLQDCLDKKNNSRFILYVGAIQPRKNLATLLEAFEELRQKESELKLVIAGASAWNYESILQKIENSPFRKDIVVTGTIPFDYLPVFYQKASLFVFPEISPGFGIPLLEAFASGVPVLANDDPVLREVGGEAAEYFSSKDSSELAGKIKSILERKEIAQDMKQKGFLRCQDFSWDECAKKTLAFIKSGS